MSAIRGALKYGQRPTAVILGDPWALHRKWWDPDWVEDPLLVNVWTPYDFMLLQAFQLDEDLTDSESGQFKPYDESGAVKWEVHTSTSGAMEAIEKFQKDREQKPGERIWVEPVFDDPDDKPTIADWIADREAGRDRVPPERRDARPPSASELAELRRKARAQKAGHDTIE